MDAEQIAEMIHDAMIDSDDAAYRGVFDVTPYRNTCTLHMRDGTTYEVIVTEVQR
ncbi:MAG: hypothetical protein AAGA90_23540 [Actinomycetota bacterium]